MANHENESLPELIARKQIEPVLPLLEWAYLKRMAPGLTKGEPQTPEEKIISLLADLVITLGLSSIPMDEKQKEYIKEAMPEIESLYSFMKKEVGFSGHGDKESLLQPTILKYFDTHERNFSFVRREDLEHKPLFKLTGGQEKRDFRIKLLRQLLFRQFGESVTFAKLNDWLVNIHN